MAANKGVQHHFAKLDPDKVREARRRYKAGGITILALANEYGVEMGTMGYAINGRTWGHVSDDGA